MASLISKVKNLFKRDKFEEGGTGYKTVVPSEKASQSKEVTVIQPDIKSYTPPTSKQPSGLPSGGEVSLKPKTSSGGSSRVTPTVQVIEEPKQTVSPTVTPVKEGGYYIDHSTGYGVSSQQDLARKGYIMTATKTDVAKGDLVREGGIVYGRQGIEEYNKEIKRIESVTPQQRFLDIKTGKTYEEQQGIKVKIKGKDKVVGTSTPVRIYIDPQTGQPIEDIQKYLKEKRIPTQAPKKLETAQDLMNLIETPRTYDIKSFEQEYYSKIPSEGIKIGDRTILSKSAYGTVTPLIKTDYTLVKAGLGILDTASSMGNILNRRNLFQTKSYKEQLAYNKEIKNLYGTELGKVKISSGYGDTQKGIDINDILIGGEYRKDTKSIYLNKIFSIGKKNILRHEFGHYLDFNKNKLKDYSIFEKSGKLNLIEQGLYGSKVIKEENFAKSFERYMESPSMFKTRYPEATRVFEDLLGFKGVSTQKQADVLISDILPKRIKEFSGYEPVVRKTSSDKSFGDNLLTATTSYFDKDMIKGYATIGSSLYLTSGGISKVAGYLSSGLVTESYGYLDEIILPQPKTTVGRFTKGAVEGLGFLTIGKLSPQAGLFLGTSFGKQIGTNLIENPIETSKAIITSPETYGFLAVGGISKLYDVGIEKIEIRTPTRNVIDPTFTEKTVTVVSKGKDYRLGEYEIIGEYKPPVEVKTTTRLRELFKKEPIEIKIEPSKEFKVKTTSPAINDLPFEIAEYKQGKKVVEIIKISGSSEEFNPRLEMNRLTKTEQYALRRLVESKTKLPMSKKTSELFFDKNTMLTRSIIESERLTDINLRNKTLRILPKGRRTSLSQAITESKILLESDKLIVSEVDTFFKDVTKPFARASGKTPRLRGTVTQYKEPIILDTEPIKSIIPANITKTPLGKTFGMLEQQQVLKPLVKYLPKINKQKAEVRTINKARMYNDTLPIQSIYYGEGLYEQQQTYESRLLGIRENPRINKIQKIENLFKSDILPITEEILKQESIIKQEQISREISKIKNLNKLKEDTILKEEYNLKELTKLKQLEKLKQLQKLKQLEKLKQLQKLKQLEKLKDYTKITKLKTTQLKIPKEKIIKGFFDEENKKKKTLRLLETYNILIRRKGKYKTVATDLTRSQGLQKIERELLGTLARTGKLVKTGRTKEVFTSDIDFMPKEQIFRQYQIRQGKRVPLVNTYIQRTSENLQNIAEKSELRQARRMNKIKIPN